MDLNYSQFWSTFFFQHEAREAALMFREEQLRAREAALEAREKAVATKETALGIALAPPVVKARRVRVVSCDGMRTYDI